MAPGCAKSGASQGFVSREKLGFVKHGGAAIARLAHALPIAALTRGMTCVAISSIERFASPSSTKSIPA